MMNAGAGNARDSFNTRETFTSVLASTTFENNQLRDVRLYPIELGWPIKELTRSGIPRLAQRPLADDILERMTKRCALWNTTVNVEAYGTTLVGVIRP
jgi:poly-gamma-glutamate synthesis protein (capsule biosynthesis protein)